MKAVSSESIGMSKVNEQFLKKEINYAPEMLYLHTFERPYPKTRRFPSVQRLT